MLGPWSHILFQVVVELLFMGIRLIGVHDERHDWHSSVRQQPLQRVLKQRVTLMILQLTNTCQVCDTHMMECSPLQVNKTLPSASTLQPCALARG